ncbi:MAG: GDP-fucose synthetase [SAR324 cluster bacterium]|uniref:GDP-L-fucose synthase n=1 Tax=SAR324 cluster bacterium TaxID=2024889 RepID=A0A2D6YJI4_9DELT|nr:GDP-fucose synthetase [SAR324 cluster bacterium]
MNKESRIYIAGHRGLVGSAIKRILSRNGYSNLIVKTRAELNLLDAKAVEKFFLEENPEYVFLAAAKVGGIHANNTYPADFLYENLQIQNHVLKNAWRVQVKKLLFLGSSCIYPKDCPQPIHEDYLLTGPLENTNRAYALAKIAGIELCQSFNRQHGTKFLSVMPTNLYGIYDNFHPENSHVLPALIQRIHEAKVKSLPEVVVWGTGAPRREFLLSDELAEACLHLMLNYEDGELVNIGWGEDQTIKELVEIICEVVGYQGKLRFDPTRPDGTPRKVLDVSRLKALGWQPKITLREGLQQVYLWYCEEYAAPQ